MRAKLSNGLVVLLVLAGLIGIQWRPISEIGAGLLVLSAQRLEQTGQTDAALARLAISHAVAPHLAQPVVMAETLVASNPTLSLDGGRGIPILSTFSTRDTDPLIQTQFAQGLNNRAVSDFDQLAPQELTQHFQQASGLAKPQAIVEFNLGVSAWQAGDHALAQESLSRAAMLDPGWDQPSLFLAYLLVSEDHPQLQQAENAARHALTLRPDAYPGHLVLIHILWLQNEVDDGLDAVRLAEELFPADAHIALYHGLFLRSGGNRDAALDVLRAAFFSAEEQSLRRRISEEILSLM